MITIKINTDNEAFKGSNGRAEVARLLKNLAVEFEQGRSIPRRIIDTNGNPVGSVSYKDSHLFS
jgi:hypothetical protein